MANELNVYKKIGAIILSAWITKNGFSHVITAVVITQKITTAKNERLKLCTISF